MEVKGDSQIGTSFVAQLFGIDREPPIVRQWRRWLVIAGVVSIIISLIASATYLLWRRSSNKPQEAAEQFASLKDFQAFQQQALLRMQQTSQLLEAQQADLKRLSDEISALDGKIEALERPVTPEPAALVTKKRPLRKKLGTRKPQRSISTGGTPLPPPVKLVR